VLAEVLNLAWMIWLLVVALRMRDSEAPDRPVITRDVTRNVVS